MKYQLFSPEIEPCCAFCEHGRTAPDGKTVLCIKKASSCRATAAGNTVMILFGASRSRAQGSRNTTRAILKLTKLVSASYTLLKNVAFGADTSVYLRRSFASGKQQRIFESACGAALFYAAGWVSAAAPCLGNCRPAWSSVYSPLQSSSSSVTS